MHEPVQQRHGAERDAKDQAGDHTAGQTDGELLQGRHQGVDEPGGGSQFDERHPDRADRRHLRRQPAGAGDQFPQHEDAESGQPRVAALQPRPGNPAGGGGRRRRCVDGVAATLGGLAPASPVWTPHPPGGREPRWDSSGLCRRTRASPSASASASRFTPKSTGSTSAPSRYARACSAATLVRNPPRRTRCRRPSGPHGKSNEKYRVPCPRSTHREQRPHADDQALEPCNHTAYRPQFDTPSQPITEAYSVRVLRHDLDNSSTGSHSERPG